MYQERYSALFLRNIGLRQLVPLTMPRQVGELQSQSNGSADVSVVS